MDNEIRVHSGATVRGEELFSPAYGYVENQVRTLAEFRNWLGSVDDVTHVAVTDGAIRFGGRRFDDARTPGLTLDDVAALYQVHRKFRSDGLIEFETSGFSLDPHWDLPGLIGDLELLLKKPAPLSSVPRLSPRSPRIRHSTRRTSRSR